MYKYLKESIKSQTKLGNYVEAQSSENVIQILWNKIEGDLIVVTSNPAAKCIVYVSSLYLNFDPPSKRFDNKIFHVVQRSVYRLELVVFSTMSQSQKRAPIRSLIFISHIFSKTFSWLISSLLGGSCLSTNMAKSSYSLTWPTLAGFCCVLSSWS